VGKRPRVLIEDWLPVAELGVESLRERKVFTDLPPLFALHVWWARRPLAATASVLLTSLLPVWSEELRDTFQVPECASDSAYRRWVLELGGILGDPVAAKKAERAAVAAGTRIPNPYSYKRAFKNSPRSRDLALLHSILDFTWGELPSVLDPTAGGGSIPFEAARYGFRTTANDLNPVAAAILRLGVLTPAERGTGLVPEIEKWGEVLLERLKGRLTPYFPLADANEHILAFLHTRTVACPRTGKQVPLSPNWWLSKEAGKEAAVRLVTQGNGHELDDVEFEILTGAAARRSHPDRGTTAGGDAVSPWDDLAISGEYIREEARSGRMGSCLYAVAVRHDDAKGFRLPTEADLSALREAERELTARYAEWARDNTLPPEEVPLGNKTAELLGVGASHWTDLFSSRQLLVHGTFVEEFRRLVAEMRDSDMAEHDREAVLGLLALMQGKALNYNSRLSLWHPGRRSIANTFDTHNFAFKSSHAEFEAARELFQWSLHGGVVRAYRGLAELLQPSDVAAMGAPVLEHQVPGPVLVICGNGGDLKTVNSGSQVLVCIDPPYYDNVMYAELSDFFYVWEKRSLGHIWPDLFSDELTDKKNEAVANVALFPESGRRRKELASADYEAKMQAIFAECHRVLAEAGVLTVMFTHKSANAWDALGMALMEAGFTIEASWPVNTESEQSLHQAKKNAAASTIMLVCRKRETENSGDFFEDVEPLVRAEARRALEAYSAQGIGGVDLLLATYGPALSVISSRWPVYSSDADPVTGRSRLLRPEEALDAARAEVTRLQRIRLVGREQSLDPITDFTMVAWDTFKAVEFPFDEARRLALAVGGLDIEELRRAKVLEKKSGTVVLLPPAKRVRRDADLEAGLSGVYPEATGFTVALDGVHTAIYIADVDGLAAAKAFLDRAGLASDARFLATLQGLVNAIPRTKIKGEWVVPEAENLDRLSAAYFPDIELPQESETPIFEQASLLGEE
jgi:putative DNA methylase